MRLSSLVVAVVLLVSPVLVAQHSSGGGSSSGGSSGSSSSGASHGGSSGGSGSVSHASSGHSSGGSTSSGSHGSGGSVSRSSSKGTTTSSSAQPSRSGRAEPIRGPKRTGVQDHITAKPSKSPQREHRGIFAFLRHRKHEPKPYVPPAEVNLRRPVCPPGHSPGKNGGCIANATTNVSTPCPANGHGVSCTNNADRCASVRAQLDAAAAELRSIRAEMQNTGCSGMSPAQECSFLAQRRDAAVARYRALQSGAGPNCAGTLLDPLSL